MPQRREYGQYAGGCSKRSLTMICGEKTRARAGYGYACAYRDRTGRYRTAIAVRRVDCRRRDRASPRRPAPCPCPVSAVQDRARGPVVSGERLPVRTVDCGVRLVSGERCGCGRAVSCAGAVAVPPVGPGRRARSRRRAGRAGYFYVVPQLICVVHEQQRARHVARAASRSPLSSLRLSDATLPRVSAHSRSPAAPPR